jgi:hypothetical protein
MAAAGLLPFFFQASIVPKAWWNARGVGGDSSKHGTG